MVLPLSLICIRWFKSFHLFLQYAEIVEWNEDFDKNTKKFDRAIPFQVAFNWLTCLKIIAIEAIYRINSKKNQIHLYLHLTSFWFEYIAVLFSFSHQFTVKHKIFMY